MSGTSEEISPKEPVEKMSVREREEKPFFAKIWTFIGSIMFPPQELDDEEEGEGEGEGEAAPKAKGEPKAEDTAYDITLEKKEGSNFNTVVEFDKYELKIKEKEKTDVYIQCELIIPKNLDDGIWLLGNNDNTIIDLNHCTTTHDVNLVQYVDPSKNILCMDVTLLKKKDDNNQTKSEIAKKKYFYCLIPNTDGVTSRNDIITDNNDLFFGLVPTLVKLDGSQRVSRRKTALNEEMMSKNLLESILTERMRESANDPPLDTKVKRMQ